MTLTLFTTPSKQDITRARRVGYDIHILNKARGNGVLVSKRWKDGQPTMVFFHGILHNACSIGNLKMARDAWLYRYGGNCNVAIVLYRSPGNPQQMIEDGMQAVDYLIQSKGVRPKDLGFLGFSMGTIATTVLWSSYPECQDVNLLMPLTSPGESAAHTVTSGINRLLRGTVTLEPDGILGLVAKTAVSKLLPGHDISGIEGIAGMHNYAAKNQILVPRVGIIFSDGDRVNSPELFQAALTKAGLGEAVTFIKGAGT
jgi:pimeloyl-ACP methyl ester carboxylesterase